MKEKPLKYDQAWFDKTMKIDKRKLVNLYSDQCQRTDELVRVVGDIASHVQTRATFALFDNKGLAKKKATPEPLGSKSNLIKIVGFAILAITIIVSIAIFKS